MTALSLPMALLATALSALVIFSERLFPFALFNRREPPAIIRFIEKYIPSMIIAILVIYSLKDMNITSAPFGAPYLIGIAATIVLHLLFKNSMVSIFGSTLLFMFLSRVM